MPVYCGCNGKALSSQRAIACALRALMEVRPYADISVSALCRAAGVSRPTFYSLFGSKDDVVSDLLRENCRYVPEPGADSCLEIFCRGYSRYITEQRRFLALLADNGIVHLLYRSIFDELMECGCFLAQADASSRRFAANFTAGAIAGAAQDAVQREACTAEELCVLLERLFSGEMFSTDRI